MSNSSRNASAPSVVAADVNAIARLLTIRRVLESVCFVSDEVVWPIERLQHPAECCEETCDSSDLQACFPLLPQAYVRQCGKLANSRNLIRKAARRFQKTIDFDQAVGHLLEKARDEVPEFNVLIAYNKEKQLVDLYKKTPKVISYIRCAHSLAEACLKGSTLSSELVADVKKFCRIGLTPEYPYVMQTEDQKTFEEARQVVASVLKERKSWWEEWDNLNLNPIEKSEYVSAKVAEVPEIRGTLDDFDDLLGYGQRFTYYKLNSLPKEETAQLSVVGGKHSLQEVLGILLKHRMPAGAPQPQRRKSRIEG